MTESIKINQNYHEKDCFSRDDDDIEPFNLKKIQEQLTLAETLAQVHLLTGPEVKMRIAAKNMALKYGYTDECGEFVPPKELLLYMVRMGSFNSAQKILNDDAQDADVRLPKNISRNELLHFCQKRPYGQFMIKRAFKKALRNDLKNGEDGESLGIKFRKLNAVTEVCSDYTTSPCSIRVFQWNILSQALGKENDNFARCPGEALDWNHRKHLIVEEIIEYCPDIICLQEVDHFNFLKHVLGTQGYTGMFFPKPDSPCFYIHGNNGPDGCAIFFRNDKFDLLRAETRILEIWRIQSNQVAVLMILKEKQTGQEICVVTTHLKARHSALLATLRNEQGKDLLNFLKQHCGDRPVILSGDFNAEPTEPIYGTVLGNGQNLASAYAECSGSGNDSIPSANREPAYTTWKIREDGEVCHTIDYIFYSKNKLEVESVLEFPTEKDIGTDRVPNLSYPSDHFSLVCDFRIRTNLSDGLEYSDTNMNNSRL